MPAHVKDLAGKRFGDLLVTERVVRDRAANGGVLWRCACLCGVFTVVAGGDLTKWKEGQILSCGCRRNEGGKKNATHGMSTTPEFVVWTGMHERCHNPKSASYKDYGGRGIGVCERWSSFQAFYADVGPRPNKQAQLDRIDNNSGYRPDNVRWATRVEQARNRRSTIDLEFQGKTQCLSAWAFDLGITLQALQYRLEKWDLEQALTKKKS